MRSPWMLGVSTRCWISSTGLVTAALMLQLSCAAGERGPAASLPAATSTAPQPAQSTPTPPFQDKTVVLTEDTTMKTSTGVPFTAPKGWTVTTKADRTVLTEPSKEVMIVLSEVKDTDLKKAVAKAWKNAVPTFDRPVKSAIKPPMVDPKWEDSLDVVYEPDPSEQRIAMATARRKDGRTHIQLLEATQAGLGRRGAQAGIILTSVRPPGFEKLNDLAEKPVHAFDKDRAQSLDRFIQEALERVEIPGAAIAVVQGGKIVHERGFGVRTLGKREPVTQDTLFRIGSMTKSLTSLMMAAAIDREKMTWDSPVTSIYPSFALGDPETTQKLALRHTVCACTGLPRQDTAFHFNTKASTPESRIAEMKAMKPTTGFGETFQYSNSLVSAGGFIAAHAVYPDMPLGPAYDEAMKKIVFEPIGMKSTTFDVARVATMNHATPHGLDLDANQTALPLKAEDNIAAVRPAGGAWSNVRDMARYLLVELGKGTTPEGTKVAEEATLMERRKPMVRTGEGSSYGLALSIMDWRGIPVIAHTGGTYGFSSSMLFLPAHDIGLVILTNAGDPGPVRGLVERRFFELVIDAEEKAAKGLEAFLERRPKDQAEYLAKVNRAPDKAWLEALAGSYHHADLGTIRVMWDGKRGILDANEWKSAVGSLESKDGGDKLLLLDPPRTGMTLKPGETNGKRTLTLEVPQHSYVFERK
jgi:CubicO group peptidase (beta-lactamase class C family)